MMLNWWNYLFRCNFFLSNYYVHLLPNTINYRRNEKATYFVIPFNRNQLKDQLLMASSGSSTSAAFLLESLVMLIEPQVSWSCKIVAFLLQRNIYYLIREIIFTAKVNFSWPKGLIVFAFSCACSCYMESLFFFLMY